MIAADPKEGDELDPDALASLEEERDFLLRSIEDLQHEYDAGDIDTADFQALSDDYTVRTAEVLRAIEERRAAFAAAPRNSPRRTLTLVAGLLAVGILAGILVAQASGRRQSGEGITGAGAVPRTATQDARECVTLTSSNKVSQAVDCYRKVLDRDPKNPTALTYLGWTLVLTSGSLDGATGKQALTTGKQFIDKAIESDPTFPDAYAFEAIVADREGRPADALGALNKLETLNPPPDIRALTTPLRDRLEKAVRETPTTAAATATTSGP